VNGSGRNCFICGGIHWFAAVRFNGRAGAPDPTEGRP